MRRFVGRGWYIVGHPQLAHKRDLKMADSEAVPPAQSDAVNTKRLDFKKQTLDDAYAAPANLLEIEVCNPETHLASRARYTDYEVRMRVCL